ncbi:unnamed protein product, partial [Mesorhabditis spiculigera]
MMGGRKMHPISHRVPPQTAMDEKFIEQIWERLRSSIREIQNKRSNGLSFEELYRNAYNMVLHKNGQKLYQGLREVIVEHLRVVVREPFASTSTVLKGMRAAWHEHLTAMKMIRDILMYVDRVYVPNNNVEPVYNLGLSVFRDEVVRYNGVNERMRRELLDMVEGERHGDTIDWLLVKDICALLAAIDVYSAEFELPFLDETTTFYRQVGRQLLSNNPATIYVRKVEQYITEETDRALRYLEPSTREKLLEVVDNELITAHLQELVEMEGSGVVALLNDSRFDELLAMFKLIKRVPTGPASFCRAVTTWVRQRGENIADPQSQSADIKASPVVYITKLMELKQQCDQLLHRSFEDDATFKNKIHSEFETFINKNSHSPEHLVTYIDDKLKKGARVLDDAEIDVAIQKAMEIFRFINDKDVFEHYYKRSLARRLLMDRSASNDFEKLMVGRLKTECGYQYTQKLELMFKDRELWHTMQSQFRDFLNDHNCDRRLHDLQIRVLTSGAWSAQQATQGLPCRLPPLAEQSFRIFQDFYSKQHNGRKLALSPNLGNAELKAIFYSTQPTAGSDEGSQVESTTSYDATPFQPSAPVGRFEVQKILQVSTYQMTILMLFNYKHKIASIVDPNANSTAARPSKTVEPKHPPIRLTDDRKHEVECAVVLRDEGPEDARPLFPRHAGGRAGGEALHPTPALIKQRNEALIERDYLVRDNKDPRIYSYVS